MKLGLDTYGLEALVETFLLYMELGTGSWDFGNMGHTHGWGVLDMAWV